MKKFEKQSVMNHFRRGFMGMKMAFILLSLTTFSGFKSYSENPPDEGMWLPILLERLNYVDMQKMGLHLTAAELYDINHSSLKDAIVGLSNGGVGGFFCTAEVVSTEGLLFTNHHCGLNTVQEHSTTEHDYLTNGFWAMSKAQELKNENLCASFLIRMENVTDSILPMLSDTMKESDRTAKVKEISDRIKKRANEKGKYETTVKAFYAGNEYYLFIFQIYKDVRLVGAPPSSIGKFGGDTDNWMWPRHTCDFSILRIYADSANNPTEYSERNVPYKPKHHLPISLKGIKKNDFAMIWGYPGSTTRYVTSYGLEYSVNIVYPTLVKIFGKELEVMKERMDVDKQVKIDYAGNYASIANTWKNFIGQEKMLVKNKVEDKKLKTEEAFTKWVNLDPERSKKYGTVLDNLKKSYEKMEKIAIPYFYSIYAGAGLNLVGYTGQFGDLKSALEKKNKAGIKEAVETLKKGANDHFEKNDYAIAKKTFAELLKLYAKDVPKDELPTIFQSIDKEFKGDIDAFANEVYTNSIFATKENLIKFLDHPKLKVFEKDLGWITAQSLREANSKYQPTFNENRTLITAANRKFIAGLREMNPKQVPYPDANSTMRMSYGQVLDYFPADAVTYDYYTTLKGVMQKEDPNNDEFIVEKKLKELYAAKDYGQYGQNGEMVTCFLTTNDITGGNSGSPVMNGDGQLIGLAFDGNWEAMSGDISFEPDLQRTINVDIRYVLFIIDKFAGASNLVNELTLVK